MVKVKEITIDMHSKLTNQWDDLSKELKCLLKDIVNELNQTYQDKKFKFKTDGTYPGDETSFFIMQRDKKGFLEDLLTSYSNVLSVEKCPDIKQHYNLIEPIIYDETILPITKKYFGQLEDNHNDVRVTIKNYRK